MDLTTPLLTILGSGFVVAVVTHMMTTARTEKEFLRQKLELVYMDGIKFNNMLLEVTTVYFEYHKEKYSQKQVDQQLSLHSKDMVDTSNELLMLTNIYFPKLVSVLNEVLACRDVISHVGYGEIRKGMQPNHAQYQKIYTEFEKQLALTDKFNKAVYAEGQRINKTMLFFR